MGKKMTNPVANNPSISMVAQYIKDFTFKNPGSPEIYRTISTGAKPKTEISLNLDASEVEKDLYEVVVHLTAKSDAEDKTMFTVDLKYAGLFMLSNIPDDQKELVLLIHCPTLLFPFARRVLADITRDGQFMPLMVDPVDFAALYQQRKTQEQEAGK